MTKQYRNVLQALIAEAKKHSEDVVYQSQNRLIASPHLYTKGANKLFENIPPIGSTGVMMTGVVGGEFATESYYITNMLFGWNKKDGFKRLSCEKQNQERFMKLEEDDNGGIKYYTERIEILQHSFTKPITHIAAVCQSMTGSTEKYFFVRIYKLADLAIYFTE